MGNSLSDSVDLLIPFFGKFGKLGWEPWIEMSAVTNREASGR